MSPEVGVVILNWRDYESTLNCIDAVHDAVTIPVQLIVVDNESNPEQRMRLADRDCTVVTNEDNRGFTGGCNDGLSKATDLGLEYICFLNNDTVPHNRFLSPLIGSLATPGVGAAGGVIYKQNSDEVWFGGGQWNPQLVRGSHIQRTWDKPIETEWITGCLFASSVDLLNSVGGFDERYFLYLEDVDLSRRLTEAGKRLIVNPKSTIEHKVGGSLNENGDVSRSRAYYVARNRILFSRSQLSTSHQLISIIGGSILSVLWANRMIMDNKAVHSADILRGIRDGLQAKWGHTSGYP